MKYLHCAILLLVLCSSVSAQQPRVRVDWLDAAWAGTIIGDRVVTHRALSRCPTCKERSPLPSWATMTIQFSALGITKWLEHKYPEHRTGFRVFKGIVVGVGAAVIINNIQKGRR